MNTRRVPRELAVDLLDRSTFKIQHAAVLSDKRGPFAWGWNHPISDFTEHAEKHAMERANPKRVAGSCLTVAGRKKNNGNWVYSKPCAKKCLPLAAHFGVRWLEFINKQGEWEIWRLDSEYVRIS